MRSMLTAFAALTALALPAGLPTVVLAQDEVQAEQTPPPSDAGARYQPDEPSAPPVQNWIAPRSEVQPARDRRGDRGVRDGDGNGRDRGDDGQGRRDRDRGNDRTDWNRPEPDTPVILPPTLDPGAQGEDWNPGNAGRDQDNGGWNGGQGRGDRDRGGRDWNRGNEGRDRGGGRNGGGQDYAPSQDGPQRVAPRGSFADSCSGSYVNQGRLYADCRDTRGNVRGTSIELARCSSSDIGNDNGLLVCHNVRGDYEGRGNNGGWDRDRNRGGRSWNNDRNGRRDYGGFDNRWDQNDWRRDWSRSRSYDWWRNDRSFRGYTGYRYVYYFAPIYGY